MKSVVISGLVSSEAVAIGAVVAPVSASAPIVGLALCTSFHVQFEQIAPSKGINILIIIRHGL
jgi:hypothetical protein